MVEKVVKDIEESITANATDEEIENFAINYTCRQCYENKFDKSRSCEECINGKVMEAHKEYLYRLAIQRRDFLRERI